MAELSVKTSLSADIKSCLATLNNLTDPKEEHRLKQQSCGSHSPANQAEADP